MNDWEIIMKRAINHLTNDRGMVSLPVHERVGGKITRQRNVVYESLNTSESIKCYRVKSNANDLSQFQFDTEICPQHNNSVKSSL